MSFSTDIDDRTIELIAQRVAVVLRDELEAIAAELAKGNVGERPLTVENVAERFGVARSTVYAHWREWGGYKLGQGEKTAIRFPPTALPKHLESPTPRSAAGGRAETAKRKAGARRRALLPSVPRLPMQLGDEG